MLREDSSDVYNAYAKGIEYRSQNKYVVSEEQAWNDYINPILAQGFVKFASCKFHPGYRQYIEEFKDSYKECSKSETPIECLHAKLLDLQSFIKIQIKEYKMFLAIRPYFITERDMENRSFSIGDKRKVYITIKNQIRCLNKTLFKVIRLFKKVSDLYQKQQLENMSKVENRKLLNNYKKMIK